MEMVSSLIVIEKLWRADPDVDGATSAADFRTGMTLEYGEKWMAKKWLPKITGGETLIATAISEPGHGSDFAGIEARAKKDGDEYILNGQKMWITKRTVSDVALVMTNRPRCRPARY